MNKTLSISPDEVMRKLQSGEWVVVSREKMAEFRAGLNVTTPAIETLTSPATSTGSFIFTGPTTPFQLFHEFKPKPGIKINLGSGQRAFKPPWINVDVQPKWCPDVIADGANLKDHFRDDTAEVIVLHHVLEHFGCGEADAMLKECHRILQPGGSLIVTVPDMAELCAAYLRQYDMGPGRVLETQVFMTNVYGAYLGDDADRHKWGFDPGSLYATLQAAAPWKEVKTLGWSDLPGASIARDWWILGLEAVKS